MVLLAVLLLRPFPLIGFVDCAFRFCWLYGSVVLVVLFGSVIVGIAILRVSLLRWWWLGWRFRWGRVSFEYDFSSSLHRPCDGLFLSALAL